MKIKNNSKPHILCICAVGTNRSKYLASYLKKKGYSTRFGGVSYREEGKYNPLKQKDVDWADILIIVRKKLLKIFKKKYKFYNKRIIVLDVTDSKDRIPKEFSSLKILDNEEFQKKWTYSQLRKAIKPYLPIKKQRYYIIIRGPLGCGKTTIAKRLAKILKGKHIMVDKLIDKHKLYHDKEQGYISQKSFFKVNKMVESESIKLLDKEKIVIFDGNFYWKSQIDDLIHRLDYSHYIFTLKAPLKVCIERDNKRFKPHGKNAATVVYNKTTSFDYGTNINAVFPLDKIINKIISHLPK